MGETHKDTAWPTNTPMLVEAPLRQDTTWPANTETPAKTLFNQDTVVHMEADRTRKTTNARRTHPTYTTYAILNITEIDPTIKVSLGVVTIPQPISLA